MAEHAHSDPRQMAQSPALDPDAVIERLAALAEQDMSEADFYRVVVTDLVQATAGFGAALWTTHADGLRLATQHQLSHSAEPTQAHRKQLDEALARKQCLTVRGGTDTSALEILCPWPIDENECGVLELLQKADISDAALAGQQRFVSVVADLITAYHRNRHMEAAAEREEQWRQIDRFVQAIHRPLDLDATAYEVANEGRRLVGCDRLTVLIRRRGRWRAVAVSGSDTVNRRSSVIAHLELLAGLIAAHQHAVWSGSHSNSPPPEFEESLDDYHDVSSARLVAILPLSICLPGADDQESPDNAPFGVLVFERFDQTEPEGMRERCDSVCRHSASALHRSLVNDEMPLRRLSRLLDRSRWVTRLRQQPWTILVLIAAIALVLVLAMVPTSLRIEATGSLQPRSQNHLFAPTDGVVERLLVHEAGQLVDADEELIRLRDPELQFEAERVLGDLETARKQLAGSEAERLHADRASRSDLREAAQRSAEEETLRKRIEGLQRQQAILLAREEKLSVRSPIEGQVLTWDVEQLLQSRPVGRGQILLTVADLQGPWGLELEIPDDQIADVTQAIQSQKAPLTVHFILATAPEVRYAGTLEDVAPATDVRADQGPTVSAVVSPVDQEMMRTLRPGASVVAKIDCGQRSMLYVLTRGLLRAIRTHVLF